MDHPLSQKWTFWFILFNHQRKMSQYQIEEIATFDTVESFLDLNNSLPKIDEIKNVNNKRASIGVFTQTEEGVNIKPMWEDPANSNGGSFNFLVPDKIVNNVWHSLLFLIIGGSFQSKLEDNDKILGITIGPKKDDQYGIEIWNLNKNTRRVNQVKDFIKSIDGLRDTLKDGDIFYKAHK
ncbi:hypothetical protein M9Y10_019267 [Tritrichomonas musculus]|uniref:Uncharacterized protein n=1 Tax=Tritrichomonas musculus TaxID=1915356 RepID=A0ABR2HJ00_9EUKA